MTGVIQKPLCVDEFPGRADPDEPREVETKMKSNRLFLSALPLILLWFLSGCYLPTTGDLTWYVSTTGDDSNTCHTPELPCRNIGTAITRALPGDTIHVAPGTYRESNHDEEAGYVINKTLHLVGSGADAEAVQLESTRGTGPVLFVTGHHVHPTVENLTLLNGVGYNGNGINVIDAGLTLIDSVSRNNAAAGVNFWTSDPEAILEMTGVLITHNAGGGVTLGGLGLTQMDGVLVSGNTNSGGIVLGTLAFGAGGTLDIKRTTISGNQSGSGGGGLWVGEGSTAFISSSTISGHEATAIINEGRLELANTTVSGNGVGIRNVGDLSLIHSTIAYNRVLSYDGMDAIRLYYKNTILLREADNDCFNPARTELIMDGNNMFCWADDPQLGPLADNGGPTQTIALLPGSPAIDAAAAIAAEGVTAPGTDADFASILLFDQRGETRPFGSAGDIGAYEFHFVTVAATNVTPPQVATASEPTATPTPTLNTPMFTFTEDAFGRNGPGSAYEQVTVFLKGQSVEIDGLNPGFPRWWWVRIPGTGRHGWVSDATGTTSGDVGSLPIYTPVPLPTFTPTSTPTITPTQTATLKY